MKDAPALHVAFLSSVDQKTLQKDWMEEEQKSSGDDPGTVTDSGQVW
jgi:hypothetical protein